MLKVLAIIPARGGSKGIKNKNIRPFCGQPLLNYTVAVAKRSKYINRIVVSTEDEFIAAVSRAAGAEIPCLRPAELAQDASDATDAFLHMLAYLKEHEGYAPDYLVELQVTSPLRLAEDVDGAFELMRRRGADAIVSVCRTEQLLYTKDENDALQLVSKPDFLVSTNRQALPPTYKLDGCMVYIVKVDVFVQKKTDMPPGVLGYEIPRWRAVDLDDPQDFVVGELIYENREQIAKRINEFN